MKETENVLYVPVVCASFTLNSSKTKIRRRAQETGEEEGSKGDGKYTETNTQRHTLKQLYIYIFAYGTCKIANRSTGLSH